MTPLETFFNTSDIAHGMALNSPAGVDFQQYLRGKYSLEQGDDNVGLIETFDKFIINSVVPKDDIESTLKDLVRTIHRIFEFEYIAVSLRSKKDGLYRYLYTSGLSVQTDYSYKQIAYSSSDLFDNSTFPSIKVGRFSHFYLAEDKPYKQGEEKSYTRPNLLVQTRLNADDMLEGDYIDVFMYGPSGDILGYLEFAGTRSGKMPERRTMKWIELIALFTSKLLQKDGGES